MAAQKGKSILIKSGDGQSPEQFTTLAGMRSKSITLGRETVDITNSDSAGEARELLAGAGVFSSSVSGSGIFEDSTQAQTLNTRLVAGTLANYQFVLPGLGTYQGAFQVTQMDFAGEHNGEVTYDLTFESSGQVTFTAE